MKNNQRRKKYLGTALQKKLLFLVFFASIIPVIITAASLYYLIFNLMAYQMAIPEIIINNLLPVLRKVNVIIAVALPVVLLAIWLIALELSHRIAGPLYRIERELDERIQGNKQGPIKLRRKDEFKALVEKINIMIAK